MKIGDGVTVQSKKSRHNGKHGVIVGVSYKVRFDDGHDSAFVDDSLVLDEIKSEERDRRRNRMSEEMKKDYANINATYGTQAKADDFKICLAVKEDLQNEIDFSKRKPDSIMAEDPNELTGYMKGLDFATGIIKKYCNNVYGSNSTEVKDEQSNINS